MVLLCWRLAGTGRIRDTHSHTEVAIRCNRTRAVCYCAAYEFIIHMQASTSRSNDTVRRCLPAQ